MFATPLRSGRASSFGDFATWTDGVGHGQRGGEAAEHGRGGRLEAANCRAFYWMRNKSWHLSSFFDVWEATRWGYQESGALAEERCFLMDSKR